MTILVHGYSNVVCGALVSAAKSGVRFQVLCMNEQGPVRMACCCAALTGETLVSKETYYSVKRDLLQRMAQTHSANASVSLATLTQ